MNGMQQQDIIRTLFDALPSLIFVVDEDVRIQEYNEAASKLFDVERKSVLKKRTGEILHCVHLTESPEGCGRAPSCKSCIIRNAIQEAFQGRKVIRRRSRIELSRDGITVEIFALITASPFLFQNRSLVLLVIEDLKDIAELQGLTPICSVCRKVRDDKDSWMRLESYFKNNWDIEFSHGYCPDCHKIEMDKIKQYHEIENGRKHVGEK